MSSEEERKEEEEEQGKLTYQFSSLHTPRRARRRSDVEYNNKRNTYTYTQTEINCVILYRSMVQQRWQSVSFRFVSCRRMLHLHPSRLPCPHRLRLHHHVNPLVRLRQTHVFFFFLFFFFAFFSFLPFTQVLDEILSQPSSSQWRNDGFKLLLSLDASSLQLPPRATPSTLLPPPWLMKMNLSLSLFAPLLCKSSQPLPLSIYLRLVKTKKREFSESCSSSSNAGHSRSDASV